MITNSQRVPALSSIPGQSSWRPRTKGLPSSCSARRHRGRRAHPEDQIVLYGVCRNNGQFECVWICFFVLYIRLTAIHGVKGLVEEEADGPRPVNPRRTVLVHVWGVVEHGAHIGNDKGKARKSDLLSLLGGLL